MWIEYLSDVLSHIQFISSIIAFMIFIGIMLQFMSEKVFVEKIQFLDNVKLIPLFIIFLLLSVFTPSTLKYKYVQYYINENAKLQKQVLQMETAISEYKLEKKLEEVKARYE